jgi:hypothetical protein
MPHAPRTIVVLASLGLALACDSAGSGTPAPSETKSASSSPAKKAEPEAAPKTAAPEAAAKKAEPEAAAPLELVEHDLSSADPEWSGWVAKGAKDGKVMADGVKGARIASNGRDGFDLNFKPKHVDLKQLKKNLEIGAAASEGKMTLTFTKDAADGLEWTSVGYGTTSYSFVHLMKVAGRDVSCGNNYMVGIRDEGRLQQHKDACTSLAKK